MWMPPLGFFAALDSLQKREKDRNKPERKESSWDPYPGTLHSKLEERYRMALRDHTLMGGYHHEEMATLMRALHRNDVTTYKDASFKLITRDNHDRMERMVYVSMRSNQYPDLQQQAQIPMQEFHMHGVHFIEHVYRALERSIQEHINKQWDEGVPMDGTMPVIHDGTRHRVARMPSISAWEKSRERGDVAQKQKAPEPVPEAVKKIKITSHVKDGTGTIRERLQADTDEWLRSVKNL